MPSVSSGEPKTGSGTTPPVYSATSYVPAVLASPLSVRATVLRRPELFEESAPELVEEGDILFDVLANPLYYPSKVLADAAVAPSDRRRSEAVALNTCGVGSVLSLPSTIGKHFVGQVFRAFLSFHNAATYPLSSLLFRIESFHPTQQRTSLVNYECSRLEGKGNASFKVDFLLKEPGQHTLSVVVKYLDIVNETKRLTWSSGFQVEKAITEVHKSLHIVPILPYHQPDTLNPLRATGNTLQEVMSNITLPTRKYILSLCLQNTSSVPLAITSVELHSGEAFEVLTPPHRIFAKSDHSSTRWLPESAVDRKEDTNAFRMRYAGGGVDAIEDLHMRPKDRRNYYFELLVKPDAFRSLPLCHRSTGGSVTVASSNLTDLGHVEWKWRRPNGDGGTECSSVLRIGRLAKQPTLEMFVVGLQPETPKAGKPMTLECRAINYDPSVRVDLALRVRPEELKPSFVYAGPLICPLGLVEPRGSISFSVLLVPWKSGWFSLQRGLELCDARAPANVLWPLRPVTTEPPPLSSMTPGTAVIVEAEEQLFPPVLCELLVC
ncbi:Trafficking protein particle complex subunit 13 [Trypanosoma melophagium]|uniref:Trafficking protein particle complex subunit 13 n=1 Tax=Trypanosoma melophagium TaxID=715481 RepID=UPI003519DC68|nr:Trafficking protein particle complex subunit 13 [Trypanosoma melophagium]